MGYIAINVLVFCVLWPLYTLFLTVLVLRGGGRDRGEP